MRADGRALEVAEDLQADGAARPANAEVRATAHERAVALQPRQAIGGDGERTAFTFGGGVAVHAWIAAAVPVRLDAMAGPCFAVVAAHHELPERPKHDLATFRDR